MKTTASTSLIACAVIAGAFTVGFASGPAFAQPEAPHKFEFEFTYSGNELATVDGANALLQRLESTVRSYCGGNERLTLGQRRVVDMCVDNTMKESIAKFQSPAVAQAFESRAAG